MLRTMTPELAAGRDGRGGQLGLPRVTRQLIAELKTKYNEPWMTQNAISTYADMWVIKSALEKAGKADRRRSPRPSAIIDDGPSKFYPGRTDQVRRQGPSCRMPASPSSSGSRACRSRSIRLTPPCRSRSGRRNRPRALPGAVRARHMRGRSSRRHYGSQRFRHILSHCCMLSDIVIWRLGGTMLWPRQHAGGWVNDGAHEGWRVDRRIPGQRTRSPTCSAFAATAMSACSMPSTPRATASR